MGDRRFVTIDGNQAISSVAYRTNEVIAIYPITPASPMGEFCDEWAARGDENIWGIVPRIVEMQSEAGAAGACHGMGQAGALTTTFTASQGLLLMVPNMYKIAGELSPQVIHIAARTVSTHALSIFGDHSDVMACRQTGWALLASGSVQEAHDLACIAQMATLRTRIPFLHYMDGFRTSHEVAKIEEMCDDDLRTLIDPELIVQHRKRALSPDAPVVRGTAQNPDAFFQAREACNPYYDECPDIVQSEMDRFAAAIGRSYHLFDYIGHPEAERVVIMMGSGAEAAHEMVEWLVDKGERVGLVKVRLYRPFKLAAFIDALPASVRSIAVLDRTKEPGALGEPLYLDVVTALTEGWTGSEMPRVAGGRYGLSSKEFTPAMVKAVYDELGKKDPQRRFTIGINDDVTHLSLDYDDALDIEPQEVTRAVFFGLGADGTVGASKNSVKILGADDGRWAQGYFEYDSKKAGAVTVSHLRFGPKPIRSTYKIREASFLGCHQFVFLERYDMFEHASDGAVFLLNAPCGPDEVWDRLPLEAQEAILRKKLEFYVIDANEVAKLANMPGRINTIMQTCFFALSGVLPREQAIARIKQSVESTYGKKAGDVVARNIKAIDEALGHLHKVEVPAKVTATVRMPPTVAPLAPDFVKQVEAMMMNRKGNLLPVSAFPVDGTWPLGTTRWEKRNLATEIPVWDEELCIQCNKCAFVCPHAAIRVKVYEPSQLDGAPATFKAVPYKGKEFADASYTVQVAPEDCTGCTLCVKVCPAKDKANPRHKALDLAPQPPLREPERDNYDFFLQLPEVDRSKVRVDIKGSQFFQPLFEYSGACEGCGETPYVKLLTQLFGDRTIIANATGCSSIYGGNLPTTPYAPNGDGRGPAWSNSLFEDNAEFGLGIRLAVDYQRADAEGLLRKLAPRIGERIADGLLAPHPSDEAGILERRRLVEELRAQLRAVDASDEVKRLDLLADYLVPKSVWIVGGDGWAYDIGYGGLDHVFASGSNVNILVLDTEVYSNTGGQQSKATPMGAAAKFATAGKPTAKKDLALLAMSYGGVYVARVASGAKDTHTVKAFAEAESYPGTSLILAYSPCIAHGYRMIHNLDQQKLAVDAGHWSLMRFDPRRMVEGKNPLQLDSPPPKIELGNFVRNESRFRMVEAADPERFRRLLEQAQSDVRLRSAVYQELAKLQLPADKGSAH